jgi:hypothetical protein
MKRAYGSPCEGVGNWCPTTVPQAGGVRGPKMRHLVLYKLAGFFPTDWQPIGRELCPQKRCQKCAISCTNRSKMPTFRPGNALFVHFLQGGGATFWQAKNGGFWGPGSRARLVPRVAKTVRNPSRQRWPHRNIQEMFRKLLIIIYGKRCSTNASWRNL